VRARVLPASSLPARNDLAGGGLVGLIFCRRWCVMSTLPLSTPIERTDRTAVRRLWDCSSGGQRCDQYPTSRVLAIFCRTGRHYFTSSFVLRHPAAPPPIRIHTARTGRQISQVGPVPCPGAPNRLCTRNGTPRTYNTASLLSHTSLQFFSLKHLYVTTDLWMPR
jgi:hypothetical protein